MSSKKKTVIDLNNNDQKICFQSKKLVFAVDKTSFLILLGMLYATLFFSSFIMGYKVVHFYGRIFCASVFIFPLLFPLNDAITELFNVRISYIMIAGIITCEILFSLITRSVALLPSPIHWQNQEMYLTLTQGFLHITIADSTALAIGFFVNAYFLNKWGQILFGRGFFIRSLGATAVGELVFTILTNLITFKTFHSANLNETVNIIISDYIFKMIYSIIICVPNAIMVNKIKELFPNRKKLIVQDKKIVQLNNIKKSYR